jgi:hypothetical protein
MMRLRLSRRQAIVVGAMVGGVALAVGCVGPIVRAQVAREAARRNLEIKVGGVRAGWFAVRLVDVTIQPQGISTIRAHVDELRVGLSAILRVDRVELRGVDLLAQGSPESLRDDWVRWRGAHSEHKDESEPNGRSTPLEATGVSLRWVDPGARDRGAELRGVAVFRDSKGSRIAVTDGKARFGRAEVDFAEGVAEIDPRGMLARAHSTSLTVGWTVRSDAGSPAADDAPPTSSPPTIIARVVRGGRHARPPPPPPGDAGAPLVALPDLHAARARAAAIAALIAERVQQGANVGVDSLTWKIASDHDERTALTLGPGPLSFTRTATELDLRYSTDAHAGSTPLALRAVIPTDGSDVVVTMEGGPVSLALLGVKEQAAGLVDVDRATVSGRARLALAGDGSALTFDADAGARSLSLRHQRLALEPVRGLDVTLRARGAIAAGGEVRLDDFATTLGALRVVGGGMLEQRSDHVSGTARFEIPSAGCQSLLDSIPTALLPALEGTRMAGTFGARGRFAFDTRSLDDLELSYDVQDRCHLARVPDSLDRDRFAGPFAYRVYLPDGSTIDETTGPGTANWTPLDQISPYMQIAVLTTEDGAFPKHRGFNHAAIRASLIANIKARRFVRGASTITMQLAKNLFLSRDKTLSRKLEEVVLTDYLEQTFSKDELMELYLNVIEFGPSLYGITSAASYYFGRTPAELNLAECLFLASLLPAPVRYGAMRDSETPPEGWMRTLRTLMEVAHKRGLITSAELSEGESTDVVFWHGGERPPPRTAMRARTPVAGDASDIPDPFEAQSEP